MKVVGIIGAGASGLCATRHVLATEGVTPVVWEQSASVGGTWWMSDQVGTDSQGLPVHSSMYQNLITDIPTVMMGFPDFIFQKENESFVHHTQVLKYLKDYARHFDLLPWIKFGHHVEKVSPVMRDEGPPAWEVTVRDLKSGLSSNTTCDALLVCNGHFAVPYTPHIEGIENYKGKQIHSHDYREPSPYTGSTILLLGASTSGLDISLELTSVAKQVLLSHNYPVMIPSEFPANLCQVAGAVSATEEGFVLRDGTFVAADTIMYCTGYHYNFPFLTEKCGVQVDHGRVKPLYKHFIHVDYPSMAFIGLLSRIDLFRCADFQVQYFLSTLNGKITLPTREEMTAMNKAIDEQRRKEGLLDKHYHVMEEKQIAYLQDLATVARIPPTPDFMKKLREIIFTRLVFSFPTFKTYDYDIGADGRIIERRNGQVINTTWDIRKLKTKQLMRLAWRDFFRLFVYVSSLMIKSIRNYLRFS